MISIIAEETIKEIVKMDFNFLIQNIPVAAVILFTVHMFLRDAKEKRKEDAEFREDFKEVLNKNTEAFTKVAEVITRCKLVQEQQEVR